MLDKTNSTETILTNKSLNRINTDDKQRQEYHKNEFQTKTNVLKYTKYLALEKGEVIPIAAKDAVVNTIAQEETGTVQSARNAYRKTSDVFYAAVTISDLGRQVDKASRMIGSTSNSIGNVGRYLKGKELKEYSPAKPHLTSKDFEQYKLYGDKTKSKNVSLKSAHKSRVKTEKEVAKLQKKYDNAKKTTISAKQLEELRVDLENKKSTLALLKKAEKVKTGEHANFRMRSAMMGLISSKINEGDEIGMSGVTAGMQNYRYIAPLVKKASTVAGTGAMVAGKYLVVEPTKAYIKHHGIDTYVQSKVTVIKNKEGTQKAIKKTQEIIGRVNRAVNGGIYNDIVKPGTEAVKGAINAKYNEIVKPGISAVKSTINTKTPKWLKAVTGKTTAYVKGKYVAIKTGYIGKAFNIASKATGAVWSGAGSAYNAFAKLTKELNKALLAFKQILIKYTLIAVGLLLLFNCLGIFLTNVGALADSMIFFWKKDANGVEIMADNDVIDLQDLLTPYEDKDIAFKEGIMEHVKNAKAPNGKSFDKVNYFGIDNTNNFREIVSMSAVYMDQDLNSDDVHLNNTIGYIKHMYDLTHSVRYGDPEYYECDGCETRIREIIVVHPYPCTTEEILDEEGNVIGYRDVDCPGHREQIEEKYCPGHYRMDVFVTTIFGDDIFNVDDTPTTNTFQGWTDENREWVHDLLDVDWKGQYINYVPHEHDGVQGGSTFVTNINDIRNQINGIGANPNPSAGWVKPVPSAVISAGTWHYPSGGAHSGADYAADRYSDVVAVGNGIILNTANGCEYGYYGNKCGAEFGGTTSGGNQVFMVTNVNGHLYGIKYLHLEKDSIRVTVGQEVSQGQVIASVGSSGNSTGPHCHVEVFDLGSTASAKDYASSWNGDLSFGAGYGISTSCDLKSAPCRLRPEVILGS